MLAHYRNSELTTDFLRYFKLPRQMPELGFLARITTAFSHLPYENITKIIKKNRFGTDVFQAFRLPEEVWSDYLSSGMGGTCFSLSFFLHQILTDCGFAAHIAMADRSYGANTHCAVIVELPDGPYLVDPGFLLAQPIPLFPVVEKKVSTSFNILKLIPSSEDGWDIFTAEMVESKFRYRLKSSLLSWDKFQNYWADSFEFAGLNSVIVTGVSERGQVYMRNHHVRLIGQNESQSKGLDQSSLLQSHFKMDVTLWQKALEIVKK